MRDYEEKMDEIEKSIGMEYLFSDTLREKINMLSEVSTIGWEIQQLYDYAKIIANSFLDGKADYYPHLGLLTLSQEQVSLKQDERKMWELLEKLHAEDKIISERQNEIKHWKNYGYTLFDEYIVSSDEENVVD
tara:strand:- start:563 stop:961 length:399 start_codon:yes stop_codon:yes gene_type:complete